MRNSRSDVVAAALRVLDEFGLEACSMRRIAAELDVQPSALYHHVPDKQTLLAHMADEIVRGVGDGGDPGSAGGPEHARTVCRQLRGAMLAVRDGADVVATASAYRLGASAVEATLAEFVGEIGARTLMLYVFGDAQSVQTHEQAVAVGAIPEAPRAETFERGLDIILAGLTKQMQPAGSTEGRGR